VSIIDIPFSARIAKVHPFARMIERETSVKSVMEMVYALIRESSNIV
jgi:hypothetical protein